MTRRVFVAGGTGVLGRRVVELLCHAGHRVTVNTRNSDARRVVEQLGGEATTVDLFDPDAVERSVAGHDVVINVATAIPTGATAIRPSAWAMNDRLRTEGSANLAAAAIDAGARYVGESLTFPYVDCDANWIDEDTPRTYFSGNRSTIDAEMAATRVAEAGGTGIALRFAMFVAEDSAHTKELRSAAARGLLWLPGAAEDHTSFVHADDAASAVMAALDAPSGVYNVAEPNPVRRADHAAALSKSIGRKVRCGPRFVTRVSGAAVRSLARAQRVSSRRLVEVSNWEPKIDVAARW